jgi:hypothetical protein
MSEVPELSGGSGAVVPAQSLRRTVVAVALLAVALVHVLDLPGKWEETRWMAYGYGLLVVSCLVVAEWLLRGSRLVWAGAVAVAIGPMAGFVLTRTTGLPGATDDIGNWSEPLGLASLFVEGLVVLAAAIGLLTAAGRPTVAVQARMTPPTVSSQAGLPRPRRSLDELLTTSTRPTATRAQHARG